MWSAAPHLEHIHVGSTPPASPPLPPLFRIFARGREGAGPFPEENCWSFPLCVCIRPTWVVHGLSSGCWDCVGEGPAQSMSCPCLHQPAPSGRTRLHTRNEGWLVSAGSQRHDRGKMSGELQNVVGGEAPDAGTPKPGSTPKGPSRTMSQVSNLRRLVCHSKMTTATARFVSRGCNIAVVD